MLGAGCWVLGAGCWVLGAGCWVLGAGCWVLGAGCWVLGAGCWVLTAENGVRGAGVLLRNGRCRETDNILCCYFTAPKHSATTVPPYYLSSVFVYVLTYGE